MSTCSLLLEDPWAPRGRRLRVAAVGDGPEPDRAPSTTASVLDGLAWDPQNAGVGASARSARRARTAARSRARSSRAELWESLNVTWHGPRAQRRAPSARPARVPDLVVRERAAAVHRRWPTRPCRATRPGGSWSWAGPRTGRHDRPAGCRPGAGRHRPDRRWARCCSAAAPTRPSCAAHGGPSTPARRRVPAARPAVPAFGADLPGDRRGMPGGPQPRAGADAAWTIRPGARWGCCAPAGVRRPGRAAR